jgi:hypothetical protein
VVLGGETTNLIVDFDVGGSFVPSGSSIERSGLLFRPLISTTIVDAGTNRARVRVINLSGAPLALREDGSSIIRLGLDQISSCLPVNAAQPLSVGRAGTNTFVVRVGQELTPGLSYVVVAFDTPSGATRLVTLTTTFTPASGQAGSGVLTAIGLTSNLDRFLTQGALTDAATLASALRDSTSTLVSVLAAVASIRLTNANGESVLLDLDVQPFRAGQRLTLVVRPLLATGGALSAFLFEGC